jgi:hypothetical protein
LVLLPLPATAAVAAVVAAAASALLLLELQLLLVELVDALQKLHQAQPCCWRSRTGRCGERLANSFCARWCGRVISNHLIVS